MNHSPPNTAVDNETIYAYIDDDIAFDPTKTYIESFSHICGPETCGDPNWVDRLDSRLDAGFAKRYVYVIWGKYNVTYGVEHRKPIVDTFPWIDQYVASMERPCAHECMRGCGLGHPTDHLELIYICYNCLVTIYPIKYDA